jgi:hypothetical protein
MQMQESEMEMARRLVDALCMCLTENAYLWTFANDLREKLGEGRNGGEIYRWLNLLNDPYKNEDGLC